jgi:hypothetical protein
LGGFVGPVDLGTASTRLQTGGGIGFSQEAQILQTTTRPDRNGLPCPAHAVVHGRFFPKSGQKTTFRHLFPLL